MSLIGTAVGALMALLPRPVKPDEIPIDSELERLRRENERLTRSHARLVDHIETLEREILLEQHICAHWKEEAERLAKHAIASRLRAEAQEQQALQAALLQSQSAQQQIQNLANQQANQAQGLQWRGDYDGFCNCVPSRAQVWAENREPFAILRQGEG